MSPKPVHAVKFVTGDEGNGNESVDALVFGTAPGHGTTVSELYAIVGGTLKKETSVPHGSAEQGRTWYT